MKKFSITFLEKSDISESSRVLSKAMLNVPLHIAIFQGHGEKERKIIENIFFKLLSDLPGITFLARINRQIVGVMRRKPAMAVKFLKSTPKPEMKLIWSGGNPIGKTNGRGMIL